MSRKKRSGRPKPKPGNPGVVVPANQSPAPRDQTRIDASSPAGKASVRHIETSISFSGPLPPPAVLDGYEQVCPGAADRILRLAEKEQDHRQLIESKDQAADATLSSNGMKCAAFLATLSIGGGIVIALATQYPVVGLGFCGTSIAALVGAFLASSGKGKKEVQTEVPPKQGP